MLYLNVSQFSFVLYISSLSLVSY